MAIPTTPALGQGLIDGADVSAQTAGMSDRLLRASEGAGFALPPIEAD